MNALTQPGRWEKFFWPLLAAALLLSLWHYSVIWTATQVFPSPLSVEKGLAELLRKHVLWSDIGDSLRRVAIGFGTAAALGIPLGLMLGWYPAANQVLNPLLQILRPISPIAWIPIAIVLFGVGDHAAVFLVFLGAFFPIVVACVSGVSNVPSIFRRAGRNFGLSTAQILARVVFPAALPQILIGFSNRFTEFRQALRPGGCGHAADRSHWISPGRWLPPAGKDKIRSMGIRS